MVAANTMRASGETGANEVAKEQSEELTEEIKVEMPEERARKFRTPGFHRMRFAWNDEERPVIAAARVACDSAIVHAFPDAFVMLDEIYSIIRKPVVDANGEIVRDAHGQRMWQRSEDGYYIEDFTEMTRKQKEDFLGRITVNLFRWEQVRDQLWSEAMFAKAQFEERFAIAYDEPMRGTIDDRSAKANKDAADERYFAIYLTTLSRRGESVVRALERLSMRLKDVLTA